MSNLQEYFSGYKSDEGRGIYKAPGYAKIYEPLLESFRNKPVVLVEIGIGYGGCLQMWKKYLGLEAMIYGIDKVDRLLYEEERIKCFLGDQGDREFLKEVAHKIPNIDILIDDGSHRSSDQIASFEELFKNIKPGGVYVVEDIHTSYRELYGGGYKKEGTFIEYCKHLIDSMYYTEIKGVELNERGYRIEMISFYKGITVIKKG